MMDANLPRVEYALRTHTVRLAVCERDPDARLSGVPSAIPILRAWFATFDQDREVFAALYLDARKAICGANVVSVGCATASLVHPREVLRPAILAGACSILLAHNHPSGDPEPSPEDLEVTRRLAEAGELLGIRVVDHIILGADRAVSFSERGLI